MRAERERDGEHPAREEPAELTRRVDALEKRLTQLIERVEHPAAASAQPDAAPDSAGGALWALEELKKRHGEGAVLFTGTIPLTEGSAEYQYGRPTAFLAGLDWGDFAERLAALGHPVRLALLQRLLSGTASVSELVEALELGSTSVAYHHIGQLSRTGWLRSAGRGRYEIPPARIIPLLAIITAAES